MKILTKFNNCSKYTKLSIAVLIIAILFRFILMTISTISGDACWYFSASKFIANNLDIPLHESVGRDEPFWPPPLFHIISAFFYILFGGFGFKLVSPIFGSLTLIISYLIFRKFLDDRASFYAILFMSFIPIHIDYSILGYPAVTLTFFTILSVYFAVNNRFILSGIIAGLAILTKYNAVFIIPVLIFIAYKKSKRNVLLKNLLFVTVIPGLIGLIWFIRNWIMLGNPVWPFLNFIFDGLQRESYSNFGLVNLAQISTYAITYLGFFGVPDGHYRAFFFFDIPYIWILITIFVIGTLIFILPIFFGFKKDKSHHIFYVMLASFGILLLLFELNVRPAVSRIVLPAMFAVAFIYGSGFDSILNKFPKFGKIILVLTIMIIGGFVFAETVKFKLAADSWDFYQEDFDWVKSSTNKDDVFLIQSQCIQFKMDRTQLIPTEEERIFSNNYDYVWINQEFKLEPQSVLYDWQLDKLKNKNMQLVYENKRTKTKIYKMIR
ncbi:glycosyltransferase family 39 protein [archaeon AH-315-M20]|nr:glycosyltransferase family 39 protein [archaeon AH-315-M20]